MNILYVSPYLPRAGSHGCGFKTWDDIYGLSQQHRIFIVCFATPSDAQKESPILKRCEQVFTFAVDRYERIPSRCQPLTDCIRELCISERIDILQCECSFMARFLPACLSVPKVLTEHQVYWLHFFRELKVTGNLLCAARLVKNVFEERRWLRQFDRVVFFSGHDRDCFRFLLGPRTRTAVLPLGIDVDYFAPGPDVRYRWDACFLGNFASFANEDAVRFFVQRIMPQVKRTIPDFSLLVVGQGADTRLQDLGAESGISLQGAVEDIRPFLAQSRVFINPMRLGSGMRRKVLEAWALARPVISTTVGIEGLHVQNGQNIILADRPDDFARQLADLLSDEPRQRSLGAAGRRIVEAEHETGAVITGLQRIYQTLLKQDKA